jgi:hypothetical protein
MVKKPDVGATRLPNIKIIFEDLVNYKKRVVSWTLTGVQILNYKY